jgi:hypothetical protein
MLQVLRRLLRPFRAIFFALFRSWWAPSKAEFMLLSARLTMNRADITHYLNALKLDGLGHVCDACY